MNTKDNENKSIYNGLDTSNPNHLKLKHQELFFEVLGGINTESYMSLRVMVVVRGNRKTEREHLDLYSTYHLTEFTKRVAQTTGFTLKYVDDSFKSLIDELEIYKQKLLEEQEAKASTVMELNPAQQQEAESFLKTPNLLEETSQLIAKAGVVGHEKNSLILFLLYLSRFQEQPLHVIVQSKYNYLQNKMSELIPEEHKKTIGHLTENSLFYFEEYELSNKLLLAEDTGSNKNKLRPLLELQYKGSLSKIVTQKDRDGYLRTVQRTINGPICLSITTPKEQSFTHHAVVSFIIAEDNSSEQDEKMMTYQRRRRAGNINYMEEQQAKELLWNIQRILQPVQVINPFAEKLLLPQELKDKQITNMHYLQFIEVISFFKQLQKEQKTNESTGEIFVETSVEDIQQANELLTTILLNKCDGLNTPTRKYFEKLKAFLQDEQKTEFTNAEVQLELNIPISTVKRYNNMLLSEGKIKLTGEGNRASGYFYCLTNANELEQLKKSLSKALTSSMKVIKKLNGSPKLKVAQKQNELPKSSNNKASAEVAQKLTKHQEPITKTKKVG